MSEKEAQLGRIAVDRERITRLADKARNKPGTGLAVATLEMSLASLDMQEAIWQGAHDPT